MSTHADSNVPYVLFRVADTTCAISALSVYTMTELPTVVTLPQSPPHLRGLVDLRGSLHRLVDLRVALDYPPMAQVRTELIALLEARKADHIRWLQELRRSVEEDCEFTLQLNPRLCAFGRWYYGYTPPVDWLKSTLREFEAPHNAIHQLGSVVKMLQAENRKEEALTALKRAEHGELSLLLRLFDLLEQQLAEAMHELCILIESGGEVAAFCADTIESIEHFDAVSFQRPSGATSRHSDLVACYATHPKQGDVVTILNPDALIALAAAKKPALEGAPA